MREIVGCIANIILIGLGAGVVVFIGWTVADTLLRNGPKGK